MVIQWRDNQAGMTRIRQTTIPPRHSRRPVAEILTLTAAAITAYLLFIPPVAGIADNGDFTRITIPFGLRHAPHYFKVLEREYTYMSPVDSLALSKENPQSFCSEYVAVSAALTISALVSKTRVFDIRLLGLVHAALFLASVYAILLACSRLRVLPQLLIGTLILLVLTDATYIAWFNSMYQDVSTLVFTLMAIAVGARVVAEARFDAAAVTAFVTVASLVALSKPQHSLPMTLSIVLAGLILLRRYRPPSRASTVVAACVISAPLLVSAVYMATFSPHSRTYLFNVVFLDLLVHSNGPDRVLSDLGLDPSLVRYKGKAGWQSDVLLATPELDRAFFSKITYPRLVWFYATHLPITLQLLEAASHNCFVSQIYYLADLEGPQAAGGNEPVQNHAIQLWSGTKALLAARGHIWMPVIVLLMLVTNRVVAMCVAVPTVRVVVDLQLVMMLGAALEFGSTVLGEGRCDLLRHLFIFRYLCDLLIIWTVGYVACVVPLHRFQALRSLVWKRQARPGAAG